MFSFHFPAAAVVDVSRCRLLLILFLTELTDHAHGAGRHHALPRLNKNMSCNWTSQNRRWALSWRALVSVLILCGGMAAWGDQSVRISWNHDPDPAVAGYRLHYGSASGVYTSIADARTNVSISISGLTPGQKYYFVVAAYNSAGIEGPPSSEVSFSVPLSLTPQPLAPRVNVASPGSAAAGTQISIYGVNFTTTTEVQFGGVNANFVVASDTLLLATVPPGAGSGLLSIYAQTGAASIQFTVLPLVPPANDNFANAQTLTGPTAIAFANTAGAGKESNEPNHAGNPGGSSIWYRWTAPGDGAWSLDADGSTFTPLLAVYTGNSLPSLSPVANNRTADNFAKSLTFNAIHGAVYYIAVDGPGNTTGEVTLRLAPVASVIFSSAFEPVEGFTSGATLAGQHGWLSSASTACGVASNALANLGQQAYIGFPSSALAGNLVTLSRPLNYTLDASSHPIIQFSSVFQLNDFLGLYHDLFGWAVKNAAGHQLFAITFDNSSWIVNYDLDNAAPPVPTGVSYDNTTVYTLLLTMDFSNNRWSATLNGTPLASGLPITTTGAALTLGEIDPIAVFQNLTHPGLDAMVFDNYVVTANPNSAPKIRTATGNQTVATGSDVFLGVAATGNAPLLYQWYYDNMPIPAAISPSLVLKNVAPGQSGNYSVSVSNPSGSVSTQSVITITSPPASARLGTPAFWSGQALLNLGLAIGSNYRLQVSTNLADWTTLGSFHADGTNAVGCDPDAMHFSQRFYRVVSP